MVTANLASLGIVKEQSVVFKMLICWITKTRHDRIAKIAVFTNVSGQKIMIELKGHSLHHSASIIPVDQWIWAIWSSAVSCEHFYMAEDLLKCLDWWALKCLSSLLAGGEKMWRLLHILNRISEEKVAKKQILTWYWNYLSLGQTEGDRYFLRAVDQRITNTYKLNKGFLQHHWYCLINQLLHAHGNASSDLSNHRERLKLLFSCVTTPLLHAEGFLLRPRSFNQFSNVSGFLFIWSPGM